MELKSTALLIAICFIISYMVSRTVILQVGKNDNGRDCPQMFMPLVACLLYGISAILLLGLTVINWSEMFEKPKRISSILLGLITLGLSITYIPYIIKAKERSDDDKECMTSANLQAINVMEFIAMLCLLGYLFAMRS
jgi:hypothetical protein